MGLGTRGRIISAIEIGIVGAGAVTELCHLPVARSCPEIRFVALVDKNLDRARTLAMRFNVAHITTDYHHVFGQVRGVINALPHYLHAPVTIEFLERGIPVLVEKPIALTLAEAQAMVKAAAANRVALQVGHFMRFYRGARVLKQALDEGWLGRLESFSLEWGFVYNWPVASGFFFNKEQAGGGVLMDTGSHMLDLLLWWLGDVTDVVEYRDDSLGGVEAECLLSLVLQPPTGPIQGTVTLSRLRRLSNKARVVGDRFTAEFDFRKPDTLRIWPRESDGSSLSFTSNSDFLPGPPTNVYADQLLDFAQVIGTGSKPVVSGESVLGSVALIERCYRERQMLELPWMRSPAQSRGQVLSR